ncbi:MAG: alpha/beta hydrolase [Phycisphaerae bacterium]|nr:alpha/beta hydrolase [Phycisphaerae bacterium]
MHHTERGTGRAVVLVHGFPLDGRIFHEQLESLGRQYRVIVPDLPGFGQSPGSGPYTMASLAGQLRQLLQSIQAIPCVLGGLSMGGYVTLAYARAYPDDLAGMILIDTRAEADTAERRQDRDRMMASARQRGIAPIVEAMFPKLMAPENVQADAGLARRLRQIMESQQPEGMCHALVAMRDREDFTPVLPSIRTPTLILVGERDQITPLECAQRMHAGLARSRLVPIAGAGHLPVMERPGQTTEAIREFLKELE